MSKKSKLEEMFKIILEDLKFSYLREYRFYPLRKWRVDFYLPEYKLAIEIEGGLYMKGGHTSIKGIIRDCEKYNTLTLEGIKLLRFTTHHLMHDVDYIYITLEKIIKKKASSYYKKNFGDVIKKMSAE